MSAPDRRVVVWFSCGVTSAVAAKIAIANADGAQVRVCYTDPGGEHPDNQRFLADCERWFGQSVTVLKSNRYADPWDVFAKTRWLVGPSGARCTTELKKALRTAFQEPHRDVQVFGFDAEEARRAATFRKNNPEVCLWTPLIDRGLTKGECLAILQRAGIELPAMYRLGYRNNNCIGCVKGQSGYWNKIRRDFPDVFDRMALVERDIGAAICKRYEGGERIPVYLDELPPDAGNYRAEPPPECSMLCGETLDEIHKEESCEV